jgi:hypothetical protein
MEQLSAGAFGAAEIDARIRELFEALRRVRALTGPLPVCGSCKDMRDGEGSWRRMEDYLGELLQVQFSHGLCPCCSGRLVAELEPSPGASPAVAVD